MAVVKTYSRFGHKFLKKLVWKKPGSRQPTVLAGGPKSGQ